MSPLIGRDEEIDLLLRRWARAKAGDGQVVLISGEPGIGTSRLTAALAERLGFGNTLASISFAWKRRLVLPEPELPQPIRDIHRRPQRYGRSAVSYDFARCASAGLVPVPVC